MRTIVIQTQISSGSTRRHETCHEMDTRLIYNFKSLKMSKKINKSNFRKLLFTFRQPRHLWRQREISPLKLTCTVSGVLLYPFWGVGRGEGGGAERQGIRSRKRVLHDLALRLLFHDSAPRTFFIAFPNPVFCPSPK